MAYMLNIDISILVINFSRNLIPHIEKYIADIK